MENKKMIVGNKASIKKNDMLDARVVILSAFISSKNLMLFSIAVPITTISAPALKAVSICAALFSPPPTISGTDIIFLTAAIIALGTQFCAPLPASKYMHCKPSCSPASAVHTAISGLFAGMGVVLEI